MINIYYSNIDDAFKAVSYDLCLNRLPSNMSEGIRRFYKETDRKLGLLGKMLLTFQLHHYNLFGILSLSNIQLNEYGKPSFYYSFEFNISHSGKIAICAACIEGSIGIDIEEVKEVNIEEYKEQFSCNEWYIITKDKNPTSKFFEFWTRKEALVKAVGLGISILHEIEVINDTIIYNNQTYKVETIFINDKYKASIASTGKEKKIKIEEVLFDNISNIIDKL
ncbi:putative 4'-phosphopantetheinyl transferase [Flavobacterium sp. 9AF]|uniref:4'-phosphopantetheinyl transferase family protein n=1 Tax=Flavobacterium sp. 9AF TaxID=2653142 RepID=UPI0012EEF5F3|nr:4'-phosphopantetheinyl transferase superfamily protein [Flavobacterium sp. 9AF]VXC05573.1 putative 4'-phosphopantetheinyl transferase [Flavobacterium sp. 9AF]